jgi:hypothetical protein
MNLHVGFELFFACNQPTPMLNTHASHVNSVLLPDPLRVDPPEDPECK